MHKIWLRPLWFRDMLKQIVSETALAQWNKHKPEVSAFCMAGMWCYVTHLYQAILLLKGLIHIGLYVVQTLFIFYLFGVRPLWLSALHISTASFLVLLVWHTIRQYSMSCTYLDILLNVFVISSTSKELQKKISIALERIT